MGNRNHVREHTHFVFFSRLNNDKGAFAGFGLDGAPLKADDSGNRALYGKPITNTEIVEGHVDTPATAQPLVAKLSEGTSH